MGFYADWVFPRVMDWLMNGREFHEHRSAVVGACQGEVLEIGFGTGLNLQHYRPTVRRLTVIDPAEMLPQRVVQRVEAAQVPVERIRLSAEALPFDAGRFDAVVSTWTLCSIPQVEAALAEVVRVLRPGGTFHFVEHGRSQDPRVARRQDRWNWLQQRIGQGCNLNRPIDKLIAATGLETVEFTPVHFPGPRLVSEHFRGVARKS